MTDEKNKRHYYKYIVKAEITSQSGETRVAEKIIAVGEKDIKIVLNSIEFLHLDEKPDTIHTTIQNLNGQRIEANVKIDWFPLQAPDRLVHKWGLQKTPESYRLSREEFMKMFPNHEYRNENSPSAWPASSTAVFTQKFRTEDGDAPIALTKHDLKPGYYRFIITAENIDKDTVTMESIVRIYDDQTRSIAAMNDWLICQKLTISTKEDAVFRIAGLKPDSKLYYEVYHKDEVTERVWIDVSPIQRIIKISPKSHYENAFAVQFSMVQDGVAYNALHTVNIEDKRKELDIKFLSFRDKLQPGEQETWKIKISNRAGEKQMAEMAATLYDASLDALKSMEWWQIRAGFYYGGYAWIHLDENISHSQPLQLSAFRYEYFNNIVRQYEKLNTLSLPYSGTRTNAFSIYLNAADNQLLVRDSIHMVRKLTALRNGKKVYGIVRDHHGFVIADAPIYVNMKKQGNSDRLGIYEINAKAGDVIVIQVAAHLPFSYKLKPNQQRLDIILKALKNDLAEVVIRGYQKRTREQTTGSSYIVTNDGRAGAPTMRSSLNIRGLSNVTDQPVLLQGRVAGLQVVEDTKVYDFVSINSYDPKTGTYIINGKQVRHFNKIIPRTNFNETAFFFPQLRTNSAGEILIEFTIPQTLTRFKMLGFAHTKNMINTVVSRELVTQKQFAISAQPPRFFRERDTIWMTATLNNLSGKKLKGHAILELSDALSGKVIQSMITGTGITEGQKFELANKDSQVLKWPLAIPSGISAITYKVMAQSGKYSDGEEMTLPVLPNSMLVTETMPLNVRGNSSKTFTMDKLLHSGSSPTLRHQSYSLEFTSNPVWYAIQALPYLMEYPYECAEQTFSRFYANSFATDIINSSPKVTEVLKQWKENTGGQVALSNLERNQELKSILLEETPWVRNAVNETERKKRLGVLFDLDKMSGELKRNFDKLEQMQFPNGSFPWFNGMLEDRYITQHIVLGMSQLQHLKVVDEKSYPNFNIMLNRAIIYLDGKFSNDYTLQMQGKRIDYLPLHYLYARSYSKHINTEKTFNAAFNYYIKKLMKEWGSMRLYEQGLAALVLHRNGNKQEALVIIKSLKERAQLSEEMGMFWPENTDGWWWYQRSVETQALMVEVFDEVANDINAVEELKIWLLKNKQTTDWKTTKATTAACYALLMRGYKLLEETAEPELRIGDKTFAQLGMEEPEKEAGTGYRKVIVTGSLVTPEMAKVSIKNNNKGIAWGGVYWQYFEQLDKLTPAETGIKIKKQLFLQEQTSNGPVLHPLTAANTLKSGNLLKVRIEIYSDRDMEYIHLKDMRSSGFEPVNVISTYKYQDGLGYYESTKDASTNFFISYMKKGTYVFEYPLRVSHAGNFSNGITTLQSMYAEGVSQTVSIV